jgi:hypothetical protein
MRALALIALCAELAVDMYGFCWGLVNIMEEGAWGAVVAAGLRGALVCFFAYQALRGRAWGRIGVAILAGGTAMLFVALSPLVLAPNPYGHRLVKFSVMVGMAVYYGLIAVFAGIGLRPPTR